MRLFSFNDFLFILAATRWTIVLSLLSFALGGLLGGVIAILRISKFAPLRLGADGRYPVPQPGINKTREY